MVESVHRYNKKIESLNYEYNHMLAQTLDNQRAYFERRLQELNQEEDTLIEMRKREVSEVERKLIGMDKEIDEAGIDLERERDIQVRLKKEFGVVLTELFGVE